MAELTLLEVRRLAAEVNMLSQASAFTKGDEEGRIAKRLVALRYLRHTLVAQVEQDTGDDWVFICGTSPEYQQVRELSPAATRLYHHLNDMVCNPWKLDHVVDDKDGRAL